MVTFTLEQQALIAKAIRSVVATYASNGEVPVMLQSVAHRIGYVVAPENEHAGFVERATKY